MTTPASNDADKPAANTSNSGSNSGSGSGSNKPAKSGSASGLTVRLLAKSWLCPVEDDKGRVTFLRYSQGDELEVTEETFELLAGPTAFKPAFAKVEAEG